MDPVAMVGVWAGAVLATAGVIRLTIKGFSKAVSMAVADEFRKVWRELNDQDEWFHDELRQVRAAVDEMRDQFRPNGGSSLRDSVDRLERMLKAHVERD